MEKKELRAQVRQKKSAYTPAQLVEISVSIIEKLKANSKFHAAHTICLYSSLPDEVDTHSLIEELKSEKRILLPSIEDGDIVLHKYTSSDDLAHGEYGIQESQGAIFTDYNQIDLVVVPGMAFDPQGNRLGRGKGYYDRFLCKTHAHKIGICFPFQYFDFIPHDEHDIRMDEVIH
ncbi:MAG: 5-formyltetrahydrofolate cyclo-ligase [Paludibacteraceae bacterium]|nr:5-formyltetrahydrofolate cyclo-ligase [Paludibacteraceae bacterium]